MKKWIAVISLVLNFEVIAEPSPIVKWDKKAVNADTSTTYFSPYLLRGDLNLKVSGHSDSDGICRLLGHQKHLPHTAWSDGDLREKTALISNSGQHSSYYQYNNNGRNAVVTEITCYDGERPQPVYSKKAQENPDGSITLKEISANYGGKNYSISRTSDDKGLCKVLGFDDAMKDLYFGSGDSRQRTAIVPASGVMTDFYNYNNSHENSIVTEISCYFETSIPRVLPARKETKVKLNPDGTSTLENPKVLRAAYGYFVSGQVNLRGLCQLFGYDEYLRDSAGAGNDLREPTIILNDKMLYAGYSYYNNSHDNRMIQTITCYFN